MSDQEVLFKILDKVSNIDKDVAVIRDRQDEHIKKQDKLAESHYKLKEDFSSHKNRFLLITGTVGSIFGAIATFIWNTFTGK